MSIAAFIAFMEVNGTWILALWLVFEQYLSANKKIKANSTLQLVVTAAGEFLRKFAKK